MSLPHHCGGIWLHSSFSHTVTESQSDSSQRFDEALTEPTFYFLGASQRWTDGREHNSRFHQVFKKVLLLLFYLFRNILKRSGNQGQEFEPQNSAMGGIFVFVFFSLKTAVYSFYYLKHFSLTNTQK